MAALTCATPLGAAPGASAAPAEGAPAAAQRLAYTVVIDAPSAIRDAVAGGLDLVRWQGYEDMTEDLLDRLIVEALAQAKEAAATAGYFDAHVDIAVEKSEQRARPLTLRVRIEPGMPTRIASVSIAVTGPAADDRGGAAAAIARARREWLLPPGDVFRQSAWDAAKANALATIAASRYAAATIASSEARIDPASRKAELEIEIASGPPFRFGSLEVQGLTKYDAALVRNFSTIDRGDPYDEARLEQFIRRLGTSGYFASVHAEIDRDPSHADDATIRAHVIEAPRRRFEAGVGFTTDTRFRGNFRYADVNIDGRALQFSVEGRVDAKIQRLEARAVRPPNDAGRLDSFRAASERTDIANLTTHTFAVGATRATLEERDRTAYSLTYYEDDQRPAGEPKERSRAAYFEIERTWRDVDDLLAPTRGRMVNLQVGGSPPGLATRGFGRAVVKFAAWVPVGRSASIDMRAEGGIVASSSREGIPSVLLFRTGGDTTVRGYAFESLGVAKDDAIVGGRYYGVASIEATHYFKPEWGLAVFVDAGDANDDLRSFRPVLGYGIGARVKTPIGPLRIDLAYGEEARSVRMHMSVGLSF